MRYLILTYYKKSNGQFDETMIVAKQVKNRDLQEASVILDFKNQRIVKATIGGEAVPKDWDTVVAYYYEHYRATIERLFIENGHELPETELAGPTIESTSAVVEGETIESAENKQEAA